MIHISFANVLKSKFYLYLLSWGINSFRLAKKHTAKELERFIELYLDGVPFRELRSEYGLKIS